VPDSVNVRRQMSDVVVIRKPRSVTILQLVALVGLVVLLIGVVRFLAVLGRVDFAVLPFPFWVGLGSRAAGLALLAFTLVALRKRSPRARWLGVAVIAMCFGAYVYQVFIDPAPPVIPRLQYNNPEFGLAVERVVNVLFSILILYWMFAYGFSSKAREFFR
jgi:hypothetical protein